MESQNCPHCGARVIPSKDGICPSCRSSIHSQPGPSPPVTEALVAATAQAVNAGNPYESPSAADSIAAETLPVKEKEPFSRQAAKFSAYTPFILFLLGVCVQGQVRAQQGTDVGRQLGIVLGLLCSFTSITALILGFVGLFGGISRRSVGTIVYAIVGIILNTGYIALWVSVLITVLRLRNS